MTQIVLQSIGLGKSRKKLKATLSELSYNVNNINKRKIRVKRIID